MYVYVYICIYRSVCGGVDDLKINLRLVKKFSIDRKRKRERNIIYDYDWDKDMG